MQDRAWHFGYDAADQLTTAVLKDPQDAVLESLAWQYDPAGNRIASTEDAGGIVPARHNELNQLSQSGSGPVRFAGSVDEPGKVWVAGHEARMRHLTQFEAWLELAPGTHAIEITAEDYSDNSTAQTFEVTIADEGTVTLTYDLNGNLVERTSAQGTTTYEWDAVNRMIAIEQVDETRSEFVYDAFGRRVRIIEHGWDDVSEDWLEIADRHFLWDDLSIAEERSGATGASIEKRFYSRGVQIAAGPDAGTYTYRTDHLGSIREVVNSTGTLTARFDYSPWGEITTVSGTFDLDFGFTGHFIHHPTGLHLAPFRAYDAKLGRWISRDPLSDAEFLPEGPTLYGYVGNNPVRYYDEDDEFAQIAIGAGIGFAVGFGLDLGLQALDNMLSGNSWNCNLDYGAAWQSGGFGAVAGATGHGALTQAGKGYQALKKARQLQSNLNNRNRALQAGKYRNSAKTASQLDGRNQALLNAGEAAARGAAFPAAKAAYRELTGFEREPCD